MHLISKLINVVRLRIVLEDNEVYFLVARKRIHWATVPFRSFEEVLSSRVHSLVRVLPWPTSASATSWRVSELAIRAFRVFLLHMSVQGRIR